MAGIPSRIQQGADRRRVEAGGSYKRRKHAETDDNPLYRLPETPGGSQRLVID